MNYDHEIVRLSKLWHGLPGGCAGFQYNEALSSLVSPYGWPCCEQLLAPGNSKLLSQCKSLFCRLKAQYFSPNPGMSEKIVECHSLYYCCCVPLCGNTAHFRWHKPSSYFLCVASLLETKWIISYSCDFLKYIRQT